MERDGEIAEWPFAGFSVWLKRLLKNSRFQLPIPG
jgi:hypothetical protein